MSAVLFLDVDGVMNCAETFRKRELDHIEPANINRLRKLVERTGCEIVLSSAWRCAWEGKQFDGMEPQGGLEDRLSRAGIFEFIKRPDCRTPKINGPRGNEIKAWLARNPDVTRYAIVDDDSDMLPEQLPFFVQTNFINGGLLDEHVERLIAILTPPTTEMGDERHSLG